jgi:hypothetical protein
MNIYDQCLKAMKDSRFKHKIPQPRINFDSIYKNQQRKNIAEKCKEFGVLSLIIIDDTSFKGSIEIIKNGYTGVIYAINKDNFIIDPPSNLSIIPCNMLFHEFPFHIIKTDVIIWLDMTGTISSEYFKESIRQIMASTIIKHLRYINIITSSRNCDRIRSYRILNLLMYSNNVHKILYKIKPNDNTYSIAQQGGNRMISFDLFLNY